MKNFLASFALFISIILLPLSATAQIGPVDSTNSCTHTGGIPGGPAGAKQCYKNCDVIPCTASETCTSAIEGIEHWAHKVCVKNATTDEQVFVPRITGPCTGTDAAPTCPDAFHNKCIGLPGSRNCYNYRCLRDGSGCQVGEKCATPTGFSDLVCGSFPGASVTEAAPAAPESIPFTPITPNLGVQIPGTTLSAPTNDNGVVRVSFLAQYINGAYKYLSAVVLVVAIVMCVYGGFIYLVGSAGISDIKRGKKIILDSIMGMIIILSAYAILNTVNPNTTNLKFLEMGFVTTDAFDMALLTTTADTMSPEGVGDARPITTSVTTRCPAPSRAPLATVISTAATLPISYPGCPVTMTTQATLTGQPPEARTVEFFRLINQSMPSELTPVQRVQKIGEAAVKCGIHMGSCGKTAQLINAAAGLSAVGNVKHHEDESHIGSQLRTEMQTHKGGGQTAKDYIYGRMAATIPGWPDSWANELQPGDKLTVYNGNSDGLGFHSVLFNGWGSDGKANIIQGQWTCLVNSSTLCLKSSCGKHDVLVRVFKP